jgi:hypothetical protein
MKFLFAAALVYIAAAWEDESTIWPKRSRLTDT